MRDERQRRGSSCVCLEKEAAAVGSQVPSLQALSAEITAPRELGRAREAEVGRS